MKISKFVSQSLLLPECMFDLIKPWGFKQYILSVFKDTEQTKIIYIVEC